MSVGRAKSVISKIIMTNPLLKDGTWGGTSKYGWNFELADEGGANGSEITDENLKAEDKNIFMINQRTGKKYKINLTEV
tara:strand:+ start:587 stop:823 length:237 start_codon:yes stop_codon:yes gene_type:complete